VEAYFAAEPVFDLVPDFRRRGYRLVEGFKEDMVFLRITLCKVCPDFFGLFYVCVISREKFLNGAFRGFRKIVPRALVEVQYHLEAGRPRILQGAVKIDKPFFNRGIVFCKKQVRVNGDSHMIETPFPDILIILEPDKGFHVFVYPGKIIRILFLYSVNLAEPTAHVYSAHSIHITISPVLSILLFHCSLLIVKPKFWKPSLCRQKSRRRLPAPRPRAP